MPDGGNFDPAVLDEVRREISSFGNNVKELKDSMGRELKEVRDLANTHKEITPEIKAQMDALATSVTEKSTAIEKMGDRMDDLEKKLNRPRAGAAEEVELKDFVQWDRARLATRGELRLTYDADKAPIDEIKAYAKQFPHYLRREERSFNPTEQKAMLVGSDPDGGYLVTPEISRRILTVIYESSPMRDISNIETISTDAIEYPTDDGEVGAGWVGETEDRPETSTPQLGVQRIPVQEVYAQPKATQKLLEDASIDVETWLANKIGQKFARMEATAFVAGNGVKKPRGILTYPAGTYNANGIMPRGFIEQMVSGNATGITPDGIINMAFLLKEQYNANARWLMRRATVPSIMTIKDSQGRYLWQPSLAMGQPASLIGYPITQAADMPVIAAGTTPIAFGDFKQGYTIVDRLGITTLRDPYTAKPFVLFYARKRVGGDVTNFEAFKLMKIST